MNIDIYSLMIHNCSTAYLDKPPGRLVTLTCDGERGEMWVVPLFDGIYLSVNDFWMSSIPVKEGSSKNHMLINYCFEGRCEVDLGEDGYVFVDQGLLSIDTHTAKHDFISPTGRYKGMELIFDLDILDDKNPLILNEIGLDLGNLKAKFCPDDVSFLAQAPDVVGALFEDMMVNFESPVLLRLAVLRLLYELSVLDIALMETKRNFLTKGQTEIAKRTYQIITERPSQKHSVSQIATYFGISDTSLRNYFYYVYGESIPSLLRRIRMNQAIHELCGTDKPITEISLEVGYENQSKFSAAFKRYFGETPMEYRRMKRLEGKGEYRYD